MTQAVLQTQVNGEIGEDAEDKILIMSKDPTIIFTPSGIRGSVKKGTSILNAARALGVDLDSVCGGRGICSKCQITPGKGKFPKFAITVEDDAISSWNEVEERYDLKRGLPTGRRLGCQAKIQKDLVIDVPPESQIHKQVIRKEIDHRDITLKPTLSVMYVEVEEPTMDEPSGDSERILSALKEQWNLSNVNLHFNLLQKIQSQLRKSSWKVSCIVRFDYISNSYQVIDIYPGFFEGQLFGLAIDVGSTTVAAHLCNLKSGEVLDSEGIMNPQIKFGEDLMSRVSYAMLNENGADEMTSAIRASINSLIKNISKRLSIDLDNIYEIVFVANPVMHHLLLGLDPTELGQAPFALTKANSITVPSKDLEITINKNGSVYFLPCIAGHVGADAAAVILSETPYNLKELSLIVDVGTNAEIILGNSEKLLACSSPTGPAFEGAQITCGQRAAPGAIERVKIDPITKTPFFKIIGHEDWLSDETCNGVRITGICGSGIIEAIAEMRLSGLVDETGLIGSSEQTGSERCVPDGRTNSYILVRNETNPIKVSNSDIRAIQLAKAALYSGAKLLLDKIGTDKIEKIILAGAFGTHISPKHAMVLGMIPDCSLDKVSSSGNAAGTGARIALLNYEMRIEIEKQVKKIEKVETAIEPKFQEFFVAASNIPNGVDKFPQLTKKVNLPSVTFNLRQRPERRSRRLK